MIVRLLPLSAVSRIDLLEAPELRLTGPTSTLLPVRLWMSPGLLEVLRWAPPPLRVKLALGEVPRRAGVIDQFEGAAVGLVAARGGGVVSVTVPALLAPKGELAPVYFASNQPETTVMLPV